VERLQVHRTELAGAQMANIDSPLSGSLAGTLIRR
jgi:hypothetical protein